MRATKGGQDKLIIFHLLQLVTNSDFVCFESTLLADYFGTKIMRATNSLSVIVRHDDVMLNM